jgi:ectoine hydroxylase-related dioxygenase (phytanoyl-CoA dioxygenase family)
MKPSNTIFRDENLQQQFDEMGFVILPAVLNNQSIDAIKADLNTYYKPNQADLFFSLIENDGFSNSQIANRLYPIFHAISSERKFNKIRIIAPSFLVKNADNPAELYLHQDWDYTDEAIFQSATIWIPLENTTEANGALFVIPRSHKVSKGHRSPSLETARFPSSGLLKPFVKTLCINAGDAVIFHPALFHGSHGNTSIQNRFVITAILMPEQAPFYHYIKASEHAASRLTLNDEALFDHLAELANSNFYMRNVPSIVEPYNYQKISESELLEKMIRNQPTNLT